MPVDREGTELVPQLEAVLAPVVGEDVSVVRIERMPGGASRETWTFDLSSGGGVQHLVLRRDPPGAPSSGLSNEATLLEAAHLFKVPVARVVASGDASAGLGGSFLILEHVSGETIPRRVLRSETLSQARALLADQCGEVLAAIHSIDRASVPGLTGGDQLAALRTIFDQFDQPHPVFELAFRWLEANRPAISEQTVVHGDFRNGNLIVGPEGIRAVLDWELAHIGDPLEDLGWLCVKSWRFGSPMPVGGFGTVEQLVTSYERSGGAPVDRNALAWWEVFGNLRWGVICIVQAFTHLSGGQRSVELAAIGRRVCEVEWDLLGLLR